MMPADDVSSPSQAPTPEGHSGLPARRPELALALGGGGARGLAHILILEALDELGVRPAIIAGTSIGALLGAAYASGLRGTEIRALAEETLMRRFDLLRQLLAARADPSRTLLRLLPLRSSLVNAEALLDLVLPRQIPRDFAGLEIPMRIVATDLAANAPVVLRSGALRRAVAASISIPVLFQPVMMDGRPLVDGGLINPLPYDTIAGEADVTVAIDVGGGAAADRSSTRFTVTEVLVQSVQILQKSITRERLRHHRPDLYVELDLDQFGALEFYKPREILAAAAPAKEAFKRRLARILETPRVEIVGG